MLETLKATPEIKNDIAKKGSRNATAKKPNQSTQPQKSNAGFNMAFGISGFTEVQSLLEPSQSRLLGVCFVYQILHLRYPASPNSNCRPRNNCRGNQIIAKKLYSRISGASALPCSGRPDGKGVSSGCANKKGNKVSWKEKEKLH